MTAVDAYVAAEYETEQAANDAMRSGDSERMRVARPWFVTEYIPRCPMPPSTVTDPWDVAGHTRAGDRPRIGRRR